MFKQSRRKIVAAIMSVLILLWAGMLTIIYTSSYIEMSAQNKRMLMTHAELYTLSQHENKIPPKGPAQENGNPGFAQSPRFRLSTFYSVALTYDRAILEIRNDQPMLHSNQDLEELAREIVQSGKTNGTKKDLIFYVTDKSSYRLVAFMDNTILNESAATLLRYTLLFGCFAMLLFFFLAIFLARKIVQPLEESYQKQKQFISDAGHELKTPISVVSANAELLSREIGENTWLANIQWENNRMELLVEQLLDLARTETITPQMEQIDFSRLVGGEALPFESIAFEKGFALRCHITEGIFLTGNSTQLKQLVSILLDNALEHSTGQQDISVALEKEHQWAKLSVINAGEKIPLPQREQLFERFYRIDSARSGEDKHYGLGLAIAKSITTAHNGRIDVRCYDGLVEFQVHLPLQ